MKSFDIELLLFLLLWATVFIMTADLEITRKRRDSFKIPSSSSSERFKCVRFNAIRKSKGDRYTCLCPKNYSTFVFYNKTWGCRENEKVRSLLECDTKKHFRFGGEKKGDKLRVLSINGRKKLKLKHIIDNCTQDGPVRYFKCGGGEDVSPESNPFELIAINSSYYIKVVNTTSTDSLKGTIIKFKIICNDTRGGSRLTRSWMLLFKFKGSFNCTIPTSTPLLTITKVSKARPNVSTTLEKQSTTTNAPSKSTVVAHPDPNQERRSGGISPSLALIASVIVAVLVLLIIIALLIYRHRNSMDKSNSRGEREEKRKTVIRSLGENGSDEPENEDHYRTIGEPAVYALEPVCNGEAHQGNSRKNDNDDRRLYAPLNISGGENIYGHRNSQEIVAKDTRPKINGPISVNQGVYHLMEDIVLIDPLKGPPEGDENDTELVYNVLERSCLDGSQRPDLTGVTSDSTEDPVYNYIYDGNPPMGNVLEGPSLPGTEESSHYTAAGPMEPVYYTLEAPVDENDGDPVYNVLEATEDGGDPRHHAAMLTEEPIHPDL